MNRKELTEKITKLMYRLDNSDLQDLYDQLSGEANPTLIPDWILLKDTNRRIGELESENDELKYIIENQKSSEEDSLKDFKKEEAKKIKKEELYKNLNDMNKHLHKELTKAKEANKNLISELCKYKYGKQEY